MTRGESTLADSAAAIAQFLAQNMFVYRALSAAEQQIVVEFTQNFCRNTEFLIAPTLTYGRDIAWCVGANAALVGAAQKTHHFAHVEWVYLCDDDDLEVAGDALGYSTVRLNARACLAESRDLIPGHNLVVHEFAHILDHLLTISGNHDELTRSLDLALDRLEHGEEVLLDAWQANLSVTEHPDETEFFAYSSEAFFTTPNALRSMYPDLAAFYIAIYGLDMPARLPT